MKQFQVILQKEIKTEVTIQYGCIGTQYSQLLVVEDGRIKSIGEFLYSLWVKYSAASDTKALLQKLGEEAEKYRTGIIPCKPTLHWSGDKLAVSYLDEEPSTEELNIAFKAAGGKVESAYKFPNGNVCVVDRNGNQVPFLQGKYSTELEKEIRKYSDKETTFYGF